MKNYLFLFVYFLIISCSDDININQSTNSEGIVEQTYVFQNEEYVLQFLEDDSTNGEPLNSEVAEKLFNLISGFDPYKLRFASDMDKYYLFETLEEKKNFKEKYYQEQRELHKNEIIEIEQEILAGETSVIPRSNDWLIFYKNCYNTGYNAPDFLTDYQVIMTNFNTVCTAKWEHNNLKNVPFSGGGNWNDQISFIEWNSNGFPFSPNSGRYELAVFKDKDFPSAPCAHEEILLNTGFTQCLNKEYWCFWGYKMNDTISSWRFTYCHTFWNINVKCDGGCFEAC